MTRADRELAALRRALFLREVRETEAEFEAGAAAEFNDVEQLLVQLRG